MWSRPRSALVALVDHQRQQHLTSADRVTGRVQHLRTGSQHLRRIDRLGITLTIATRHSHHVDPVTRPQTSRGDPRRIQSQTNRRSPRSGDQLTGCHRRSEDLTGHQIDRGRLTDDCVDLSRRHRRFHTSNRRRHQVRTLNHLTLRHR